MTKIEHESHVEELRRLAPAALGSISMPSSTAVDPRHVFLINGQMPSCEKSRDSKAACRSAAIRLVRERLYQTWYLPRYWRLQAERRGGSQTFEEVMGPLDHQWREMCKKPFRTFVTELETTGVLTYRPLNPHTTETSTGISTYVS